MHAATAMLNSVFAEIIDHLSGLESYLGGQDTERSAGVSQETNAAACERRRCDDDRAAVSLTGNLQAYRAEKGTDGCRVQRTTGAEKKENGLMWDLYFTSTSVPFSFQFSCDQTPNGVTIQSP